ncbi:hypothetical protein CPB86DRAFT_362170 [Serendipita vermifera]|nr:hypothetical protein CPB86DRAFT_362170 [Serendipita vermifera]
MIPTGLCVVLFFLSPAGKRILTIISICAIALVTQVKAPRPIVDDMDPAIRYTGTWIPSSECGNRCVASPDPSKTNGGTWHVAIWGDESRSIEYAFKGTEITFYGILVYALSRETPWNVTASLTVDGEQADYYELKPPMTNTELRYNYNTGILTKSGLSDTTHTARVDLIPPTQFIFDYLMYNTGDQGTEIPGTDTIPPTGSVSTVSNSESGTTTGTASESLSSFSNRTMGTQTDTLDPSNSASQSNTPTLGASVGNIDTSSNSNSLKTGAIIGIAIGGVLLLVFLFFCLWRYRRRQRKRNGSHKDDVTPTPYEEMNRGSRRYKAKKGETPSSTAELIPGSSNEGPSEAYPMTSYPLNPRKGIARTREPGRRGEIDVQNTAERRNDPQVFESRREYPADNAMPIPLIVPMPVNLSAARREDRQQRRRREAVAPQGQQNMISRVEYYENNGNVQEGRYTGPPTDGRQTDSPARPLTAPPPYMAGSPSRSVEES